MRDRVVCTKRRFGNLRTVIGFYAVRCMLGVEMALIPRLLDCRGFGPLGDLLVRTEEE